MEQMNPEKTAGKPTKSLTGFTGEGLFFQSQSVKAGGGNCFSNGEESNAIRGFKKHEKKIKEKQYYRRTKINS